MGIVKDPDLAEEITQNTFFKAIQAKKDFKERSAEFTWLCSIAKNLCYDHFREEKKEAPLPEENEISSAYDTEEALLLKGTSFVIHKILHDLDEPYKEVFGLRVFGELSHAEIAEIFGKTESWSRVTYHRARLMIKERMEKSK